MTGINALELLDQEKGLIKPTPMEETLKKIAGMRVENITTNNNSLINRSAINALLYVIRYLKKKHYLSDEQILGLTREDLNRIPEIIFAERGKRVLLLGWIPLFGWIYAVNYILFKNRIKFLRSLGENMNIFAGVDIRSTISLLYRFYD